MNAREAMLHLMADIIGTSNEYDNDRLNDPEVWQRFMQEVLAHMDDCQDDEMRNVLEEVDREQFQEWIDSPLFWNDLNQEIEQRGQIMMTLLPSDNQGNC